MALADDLRQMMANSSGLCPGPGSVTLQSGATVQATPGVATLEDTVMGGGTINGDEKTLLFVVADLGADRPKAGDSLTWNGLAWRVRYPQILANGALLKVFLQESL